MPTIEQNIERIADALEALVKLASNPITTSVSNTIIDNSGEVAKAAGKAANKAAAGTTKDKATEPVKEPEPVKQPDPPAVEEPDPLADPVEEVTYTADDVRAALKKYRDVEGSAAMLDVLKAHGAESLAALKPESYASVIKKVS